MHHLLEWQDRLDTDPSAPRGDYPLPCHRCRRDAGGLEDDRMGGRRFLARYLAPFSVSEGSADGEGDEAAQVLADGSESSVGKSEDRDTCARAC